MRGSLIRFTVSLAAVVLLALAGNAGAAEKGKKGGKKKATRYGLGANLNRVDVRFEMDPGYALNGFLGFGFQGVNDKFAQAMGSGDLTEFSFGGYYLQRLTDRDPVGLGVVGGVGVTVSDMGASSASDFAIFGGLACEYYLPGTKKLSVEGQIGLSLHFLSAKTTMPVVGSVSGTGTKLELGDLTDGVLMLRYYFD